MFNISTQNEFDRVKIQDDCRNIIVITKQCIV